MSNFFSAVSRISNLPIFNAISPPVTIDDIHHLAGFQEAQQLGFAAMKTIAGLIEPGWTEQEAVAALDKWMLDLGASGFLHRSLAWFGERSQFKENTRLTDFAPSQRQLRKDDIFILDVTPTYQGYSSHIAKTYSVQKSTPLNEMELALQKLRSAIPEFFLKSTSAAEVLFLVDQFIAESGFAPCYQSYPFGVLGHRIHQNSFKFLPGYFINFSLQAYWSFLSKGFFGQLLNTSLDGSLEGIWAIGPHISNGHSGAKFEEILVCGDESAFWLGDKIANNFFKV